MFSILYLAYPLLIFWFIRTIKSVLFWMYLWQLKEYHIGRFRDHFRTHKGKALLFNTIIGLKILLLLGFLAGYWIDKGYLLLALFGLSVLYIAESFRASTDFLYQRVKKPKFTFKVIIISLILLAGSGVFIYAVFQTYFEPAIFLLSFDLLVPFIVSLIVLCVQPFFVMARNTVLQKAKKRMATFPNLTVIGITGSYGKTSTKEFLTTILSSKFSVLSTPEHKNSEIGIAQTILNDLKPEHKVFVVEMGSYNRGGINLLCDMVRPAIGIVTGVNEQHLATFGSLENLLSAEGGIELVKNLPRGGLIVLNGDNTYCLDLYKQIYALTGGGVEKQIYTVGKNKIDSDIWTEDIVVGREGVSFIAKSKDRELAHFSVNVLGKQQVQNMLAAIVVAKELEMTFEEISLACKNIRQEQAGMTLKTGVHGIHIIDSSYSSNPDGVMADLDYLSIFEGKKVVAMPCLIELGSKSIEAHIKIGKKISDICDLGIITTRDRFKEIKIGATAGGMLEENILLCEKPQEIFSHITTFCKEGDAVLLEGRVPRELIRLLEK